MRKNVIAILAGILLVPLTLAGCSTQGNGSSGVTATPTPSPSVTTTQENNLPKITYTSFSPNPIRSYIYILTPDYTLRCYEDYSTLSVVKPGLAPRIPLHLVGEYQISEDDWDALINALDENRFTELPEELSTTEPVMDGGSVHIYVKTTDGFHGSGGYMAGYGDADENKRFGAIEDKLWDIIEKAESSQPEK